MKRVANFHLEVQVISRGKNRSVTRLANYISGERLHDPYRDETYYKRRKDVLHCEIFQPSNAPSEFYDLQCLCNAIEGAERRYDARTAREFKGSLPNELSHRELIQIVREFIEANFLDHGLCAVAAIHEGDNKQDPAKKIHTAISSSPPAPWGRMGLIARSIENMTSTNTSISGVNSGHLPRIELMNAMV